MAGQSFDLLVNEIKVEEANYAITGKLGHLERCNAHETNHNVMSYISKRNVSKYRYNFH